MTSLDMHAHCIFFESAAYVYCAHSMHDVRIMCCNDIVRIVCMMYVLMCCNDIVRIVCMMYV